MDQFNFKKHFINVKFDLSNTSYKYIDKIGIGAYGIVCKAIDTKSQNHVAIKKIKSPFKSKILLIRTLREIKILHNFQHTNIINIINIFLQNISESELDVYVVFDLMESDLHRIISSNQTITDDHIRYFMYQILCGLNYIHSALVIHRDLKPANILVNANCLVKIADFGMARLITNVLTTKSNETISKPEQMTQYVMTRWYRAPELLMGRQKPLYDTKVDLWSCGCILAELYLQQPLFPGEDMIHQLKLIISKMGKPSDQFCDQILPIVNSLIACQPSIKAISLQDMIPKAPKKVLDLISHLLVYEPETRWSAKQCIRHIFFVNFRNISNENNCHTTFNFVFEQEDYSLEELKKSLCDEIDEYKTIEKDPSANNIDNCSHDLINIDAVKSSDTTSSISFSNKTDTTLSADSNDCLLYSQTENSFKITFPQQNQQNQDLSVNEDNQESIDGESIEASHVEIKTVSHSTKMKLLATINRPKTENRKKIITAADKRRTRKERKLKLEKKQRMKQQLRPQAQPDNIEDNLTELDKMFIDRVSNKNKVSIKNSDFSNKLSMKKPQLTLVEINTEGSTNNNIDRDMSEALLLSGGLSALFLLDDVGCLDAEDLKSPSIKLRITDDRSAENCTALMTTTLPNNLDDPLSALLNMSIDSIDLDLNFLENYSFDTN